ncbi:MAG: methyltransferase domain-containing protein [candidate division NC10 bacterium]
MSVDNIMCNSACIQFAKANITEIDVRGKRVIEVGSLDINGSLRSMVETFEPAQYIGVDLCEGHGVDIVCNAAGLIDIFGREKFDLLISTEMIEHVLDWKKIVRNFKRILKPSGTLLITTRSRGFFYHGYPDDFWRFELDDMKAMFSDFDIVALEKDPSSPGVFMMARKPILFIENDLSHLRLYSVVKFRRTNKVTSLNIRVASFVYSIKHRISRKALLRGITS